jgi:hypothetical protein
MSGGCPSRGPLQSRFEWAVKVPPDGAPAPRVPSSGPSTLTAHSNRVLRVPREGTLCSFDEPESYRFG